MKNFLSLYLVLSLLIALNLPSLCQVSNHEFILTLDETTIGQTTTTPNTPNTPNTSSNTENNDDGGGGNHHGLSGGAVTAIALGSTGVVALGALGWWLKSHFGTGTILGKAAGIPTPVVPLCIDDSYIAELYDKTDGYEFLKRCFKYHEIHTCPNSKFVLIPDDYVENKKYNLVKFKIPKEILGDNKILNVKMTQVTYPFARQEVGTKILLSNTSNPNLGTKELVMREITSQYKNGLVQKVGVLNLSNQNFDEGSFVISYHTDKLNAAPQKYASIIEFSILPIF